MRISFIIWCIVLFACRPEERWTFDKKIPLPPNVRPLGIAFAEGDFWISDPDNNQVLRMDQNGNVHMGILELCRPMHINTSSGKLFIPNFSNDTISVYEDGNITTLPIKSALDAPSAVAIQDDVIALADFYNHRVLLVKNGVITQIGEEGRTDGKLYYPTDVSLYEDKITVADAYNNRVQIFDREGSFLKVIGWQEGIQVATGLDVFENKIFVTDYYGNRLLVYDFEGKLLNIFEGHFNKPTDVLVQDEQLFVTNYGENTISAFKLSKM